MKNVREVSADILTKIEKENSYLQLVLKDELEQFQKQDKGFITEVVYGTIKYKITLDYIINLVSKIPVKKMKPFVRNLIRLSAYQLLFLDKVPASAAINEAVKIIKRRKMSNLSGFVNGVLREIDRRKDSEWYPKDEQLYLSVKYSMPEWIIILWQDMFGNDKTLEICKSLNKRASVCIRINTNKTTKAELRKELEEQGIKCIDGKLVENCLHLEGANSIGNIPSFLEGKWTVQDESAILVSEILAPQEGDCILDMCAAPGGKSTHMAQLINNNGCIISADIYEHKLELIKKNAIRLGANCISTQFLDGTVFEATLTEKFDKILADVPCSGLGIIKRKPDIRYNKSLDDIIEINKIQKKIVANAVKYLKPNGILVYSTCTLTNIENQDMLTYITTELGLKPDIIKLDTIKTDGCSVQILPDMADSDGFFIARFRKG